MSDYEDETYAKTIDDALVQNEKEIKKLLNKQGTISDELTRLVKVLSFLTADNYAEVVANVTNIMKYF